MSIERFDRFVERRLYGPNGFYTSGGQAGRRRGDFITSPEVGPLFGEVMVNACLAWWAELDQPEPFTVADLGTGPGTLLRSMRLAMDGRADNECFQNWSLVGVDRAGTHSGGVLPDSLEHMVVIGNELLDNVPFRVLEVGVDGLSELYVESARERLRPVDELDPATTRVLDLAGVDGLASGVRLPLLAGAHELVQDLLNRGAGRVCMIDYGDRSTVSLVERGGWLRAYRSHQRVDDFYDEAAPCDITTDVAIDQLPGGVGVDTQADFVRRHGIDALVDEGREYWRAHASRPDVKALKMRSRISESEALTDPTGLGSWLVAVWAS